MLEISAEQHGLRAAASLAASNRVFAIITANRLRMISLHESYEQLLWNDILVKKGGGRVGVAHLSCQTVQSVAPRTPERQTFLSGPFPFRRPLVTKRVENRVPKCMLAT